MNKEEIILIGGGGHCISCIDVIELEGKYIIKGVVDIKDKLGTYISGYKIIATDDDLPELAKNHANFLITIGQLGNPNLRIKIFEILEQYSIKMPVIVSPLSYVSKHAKIGKGTIIMHQAMVNAGAEIGENCILNSKSLVEHDAVVNNHCHISTGAIINGGVQVGHSSFIGSMAVTKQYITIPPNSFIKANSTIK